METLFDIAGNIIYASLAMLALWGLFCVIVVWRRVAVARFRGEDAQDAFLDELQPFVLARDFDAAAAICEGQSRALPQLALLAITHRGLGNLKLRHVVADRFQRDVLADLEYRLSWVQTVIKSAPMAGLLGTVVGMMGAFGKLAGSSKVSPDALASDISVALITTACGLVIAIPLVLLTATINIRIRKMEDLVGAGLTRFFDTLKGVLPN